MIFLILLLLCSNAFAQSSVVSISGYGYVTDNNGNIIGKYSQDQGEVINLPKGYTFTSVQNQAALDAVTLYVPPLPSDQQQQLLINQDAQALAIADLQNKGIMTDQQATAAAGNLGTLNTAVSAVTTTATTKGPTTGATQVNGT